MQVGNRLVLFLYFCHSSPASIGFLIQETSSCFSSSQIMCSTFGSWALAVNSILLDFHKIISISFFFIWFHISFIE